MMQRIKKNTFIFESRGFFFFYVHVNLGIEYAYTSQYKIL